MDLTNRKLLHGICRRSEWRLTDRSLVVILYISLLVIQSNCQTIIKNDLSQESTTKTDINNLGSNHCHSCQTSSNNNYDIPLDNLNKINEDTENLLEDVIISVSTFTEKYISNDTVSTLKKNLEKLVDKALSKDKIEIFDGIEIKAIESKNDSSKFERSEVDITGRALFGRYTYEYRLFQKVKNFVETHILSINLPKAAKLIGFRSFGLNKFFLPLIIGAQVFKFILFAMFLPSILGSFGKILGKGLSQISATSSQASYPPAPVDDQNAYNSDKDMGYDATNAAGTFLYPQDGFYGAMGDSNDVNDIDMSRFGVGGQKATYLPTKDGYYKNQMQTGANNYKVFQKIPSSSMILSNYDPFYSPLLSRLDGIFARLGLAPSDMTDTEGMQIGGQSLSEVKLEACREQLICLMYASPAKYAPYSNLVSAQLSRELNELRRPVSDNPEILRFFRYMRAARRGQEGADCMRAHPGCSATAAPEHTMIAAYHDINKLVTARKLRT